MALNTANTHSDDEAYDSDEEVASITQKTLQTPQEYFSVQEAERLVTPDSAPRCFKRVMSFGNESSIKRVRLSDIHAPASPEDQRALRNLLWKQSLKRSLFIEPARYP